MRNFSSVSSTSSVDLGGAAGSRERLSILLEDSTERPAFPLARLESSGSEYYSDPSARGRASALAYTRLAVLFSRL